MVQKEGKGKTGEKKGKVEMKYRERPDGRGKVFKENTQRK